MHTHSISPLRIAIILFLVFSLTTGEEQAGDTKANEKKPFHSQWSYAGENGPEHWKNIYPEKCGEGKNRQSPIDIPISNAIYMTELKDIDLIYQHTQAEETENKEVTKYDVPNMTMKNNGHTVSIRPQQDIYLVGGSLGDAYKVFNIHFHWGSPEAGGSEHLIEGIRYPLEMHIVTYDTERYTSIREAVSGYNSLAVLGVFFEVGEENQHLNTFLDKFDDILLPGRSTETPWVNPDDLLPATTNRYYRYEGSLTTPTCDESVIWTVFNKTNSLSAEQLHKFHNLIEGEEESGGQVMMQNNFRPPQPLNGREVYSSFQTRPLPEIKTVNVDESQYDTASHSVSMATTTIIITSILSLLAMM